MGRGQRFTFLAIAVVIAIVAVVLLADSSEDPGDEASTNPAPTATTDPEATASPQEAEPRETATPTPEPPPLLESGRVRELEFTQGERIRFRVRSDVEEEIHVHGYDITRDIPAGRPVTVSFPADLTGIYEIEFHGSGEEIASLKVEPE
jgi:heme/copper-type cytochrome/quinol oxidase subunit 2